nr:unnamed protein product [Callosobruchus chinensis]
MPRRGSGAVPLHTAIKPAIIAQLDQKKGGVNTVVMTNYKCDKNEVPTQSANGSTVPLVDTRKLDPEVGEYDPFQHRKLDHPTSDLDTLIHLLKGSLGSGILAMPLAFSHAGLFFGLFCTFAIGAICTYCVHILVKSAHELCRRTRVPSLEAAFLAGPKAFHPWAKFAKAMINMFLVIDLIGCCCVYVVFVSKNVKQVVDPHYELDVRVYMAALLPLLIPTNMIRNLKWLSPLSMIANVLVACGMGVTFYYIFSDLPPLDNVPPMASFSSLPGFFGTAIFALEGIGVVMPLENNMKTPQHFIGCPGVLNTGMFFVVLLYASTGFFGYLKYGPATSVGSITLNLPNEPLAQSVKIMIAIAIFFTYALQFYVPMEIIWKAVKNNFGSHKTVAEYGIRTSLLVTFYEDPGLGKYNWRLWKNGFLICFGLLGFVTGTYVSINEIIYG